MDTDLRNLMQNVPSNFFSYKGFHPGLLWAYYGPSGSTVSLLRIYSDFPGNGDCKLLAGVTLKGMFSKF
jgi:hypothetical protein